MPAKIGKFRAYVERWRPVVKDLIRSENYPFPVELVLALISVESGGKIGIVNPRSGASGVMQVMPIAAKDYNKRSGKTTSMSIMRSPSWGAGVQQIQVGMWIFARFWAGSYDYLEGRLQQVPIDELSKIACIYYNAGPTAARKRLNTLAVPTWANLARAFPKWSPVHYSRIVWERSRRNGAKYDLEKNRNWLRKEPLISKKKDPVEGFLIGSLALAAAWSWMKKKE